MSFARDPRARRPLFGHAELLQEIELALDDVGSPRGKAILLVGGGGSGKSVILDEAAARAKARGFVPVRARTLPGELAEPFRLVRDLLSATTEGTDVGGAEALLPASAAPEAAGRARTADDLAKILAPLGRTSIEGRGAELQAARVRFLEWFQGVAHRGRVAVLVDDLHLAHRESLDFLEGLAREGPTGGIAFVASIDPGPAVPAPVRATLTRWRADSAFKALQVRPFTAAEVTTFATWLRDGVPPTPEDVLRWHAETDGHPLFVELLVRSTAGAQPRPDRPAPRPGGLAQALLARLRTLDDVSRRVLTYASVLGREFDFARLRSVAELPEERLSEVVDRLVRAGILRERGEEVYEFVSEEFRASLYAGVTETRRAILHRKVAKALEARGGASDFELARHYYLGRDDPKAIEFGVRAAEQAANVYGFDTALTLVRQVLEAARRLPERDLKLEVRLLTEAGHLMDETGDLPGAQQALSEAVTLANRVPDFDLPFGRALLGLAWTLVERSDFATAEPLALEAAGRLEKVGSPRDMFAAHRVLGTLYWRRSDLELAERHQRAALAIAESDGTPHEQGHALVDVANALSSRGPDYVEATLALYHRAAVLFGKEDDPNATARVLMNGAVLKHRIGRVDEAIQDIGRALDAAERSRSSLWIGTCLLNVSQWRAERGELELARQTIDRAESTLEPNGDPLDRQQIHMIRGIIAEKDQRFEEAEREFADSLARARALGTKGEIAEMLFRQARLAWNRGDRSGARTLLAEARAAGVDRLRGDLAPDVKELTGRLEAADAPSR